MLNTELDLVSLSPLFADEEKATEFFESQLWPNGPVCPHCGVIDEAWKMTTKCKQTPKQIAEGKPIRYRTLYKCKACRKPFTVRIGTIYEDSHIEFRKWLMAFHLMASSKKGISSLQISRMLKITHTTAWFMTHRIRETMTESRDDFSLGGPDTSVEVDECYVGGKPRPGGPKSKRGRGTDKTPVVVLVERDGNAISHPVSRVTASELKGAIAKNVRGESKIVTDEFTSYRGIGREFAGGHSVVNHSSKQYTNADGEHTNTAESFFSLIKRGHIGAFHQMSERHLHRYVTEFEFRWNRRKVSDGERMVEAIKGAKGKRLYYNQPESTKA